MKTVEAGQRFRLPSGNVVEVTSAKADPGEHRCKYVEISPRPVFGKGLEFGEQCTLSVDFLLDLGERV